MDPVSLLSLLNGGQPLEQLTPIADDGQGALDAIERELQLLQLEKAANELALRQALEKKKFALSASAAGKAAISPLRGAAKAAWEQAIIADEMSKPLQVTEDVVRRFREEEEGAERRVQEELVRHVALLRTLREKVIERGSQTPRALYSSGGMGGTGGSADVEGLAAAAAESVGAKLAALDALEARITGLEAGLLTGAYATELDAGGGGGGGGSVPRLSLPAAAPADELHAVQAPPAEGGGGGGVPGGSPSRRALAANDGAAGGGRRGSWQAHALFPQHTVPAAAYHTGGDGGTGGSASPTNAAAAAAASAAALRLAPSQQQQQRLLQQPRGGGAGGGGGGGGLRRGSAASRSSMRSGGDRGSVGSRGSAVSRGSAMSSGTLPGKVAPITAVPVLGLVFSRTRAPPAQLVHGGAAGGGAASASAAAAVPQVLYTVERLSDALGSTRRESVSSALSASASHPVLPAVIAGYEAGEYTRRKSGLLDTTVPVDLLRKGIPWSSRSRGAASRSTAATRLQRTVIEARSRLPPATPPTGFGSHVRSAVLPARAGGGSGWGGRAGSVGGRSAASGRSGNSGLSGRSGSGGVQDPIDSWVARQQRQRQLQQMHQQQGQGQSYGRASRGGRDSAASTAASRRGASQTQQQRASAAAAARGRGGLGAGGGGAWGAGRDRSGSVVSRASSLYSDGSRGSATSSVMWDKGGRAAAPGGRTQPLAAGGGPAAARSRQGQPQQGGAGGGPSRVAARSVTRSAALDSFADIRRRFEATKAGGPASAASAAALSQQSQRLSTGTAAGRTPAAEQSHPMQRQARLATGGAGSASMGRLPQQPPQQQQAQGGRQSRLSQTSARQAGLGAAHAVVSMARQHLFGQQQAEAAALSWGGAAAAGVVRPLAGLSPLQSVAAAAAPLPRVPSAAGALAAALVPPHSAASAQADRQRRLVQAQQQPSVPPGGVRSSPVKLQPPTTVAAALRPGTGSGTGTRGGAVPQPQLAQRGAGRVVYASTPRIGGGGGGAEAALGW